MPRTTQKRLPKPTAADWRSLVQQICELSGTRLQYSKSGVMTMFARGFITGQLSDCDEDVTLRSFEYLAYQLTGSTQIDTKLCALAHRLIREEKCNRKIGWINPQIRERLIDAVRYLTEYYNGTVSEQQDLDAVDEEEDYCPEGNMDPDLDDLGTAPEFIRSVADAEIYTYEYTDPSYEPDGDALVDIGTALYPEMTESTKPVDELTLAESVAESLSEVKPLVWRNLPAEFHPSSFKPLALSLDKFYQEAGDDWADRLALFLAISQHYEYPEDLETLSNMMGLPDSKDIHSVREVLDGYLEAYGLTQTLWDDGVLYFDDDSILEYCGMGGFTEDRLAPKQKLFEGARMYFSKAQDDVEVNFPYGHIAAYTDDLYDEVAYYDAQRNIRSIANHTILGTDFN